nr:hypothetical protein [Halovivax sp. KZCA124]
MGLTTGNVGYPRVVVSGHHLEDERGPPIRARVVPLRVGSHHSIDEFDIVDVLTGFPRRVRCDGVEGIEALALPLRRVGPRLDRPEVDDEIGIRLDVGFRLGERRLEIALVREREEHEDDGATVVGFAEELILEVPEVVDESLSIDRIVEVDRAFVPLQQSRRFKEHGELYVVGGIRGAEGFKYVVGNVISSLPRHPPPVYPVFEGPLGVASQDLLVAHVVDFEFGRYRTVGAPIAVEFPNSSGTSDVT